MWSAIAESSSSLCNLHDFFVSSYLGPRTTSLPRTICTISNSIHHGSGSHTQLRGLPFGVSLRRKWLEEIESPSSHRGDIQQRDRSGRADNKHTKASWRQLDHAREETCKPTMLSSFAKADLFTSVGRTGRQKTIPSSNSVQAQGTTIPARLRWG